MACRGAEHRSMNLTQKPASESAGRGKLPRQALEAATTVQTARASRLLRSCRSPDPPSCPASLQKLASSRCSALLQHRIRFRVQDSLPGSVVVSTAWCRLRGL